MMRSEIMYADVIGCVERWYEFRECETNYWAYSVRSILFVLDPFVVLRHGELY